MKSSTNTGVCRGLSGSVGGKTTALAALARALTREGRYAALLFTCEEGEPAGDDYVAAQHALLDSIRLAVADAELGQDLAPPDPWPAASEP